MKKQLNVLELFAGVGGFRVGLENANREFFHTKWANQWEPSRKSQDAFDVYNYHFPNSININKNIENISDETFLNMDVDMIVGGFPCQDYSVARSKKMELGIEGKKGVLFWEIIRATRLTNPKYLILENVDRLLKSPSKQRGRDFAIMLASFNSLGYSVEWRVINAAEYGRSQRRRRVFFFVFKNDTPQASKMNSNSLINNLDTYEDFAEYIFETGLFACQFPIKKAPYKNRISSGFLEQDIVSISDNFVGNIWNTGVMHRGRYVTIDTKQDSSEAPIPLKDIIIPAKEVPEKFIISDIKKLEKFKYLRGSKKIERTSKDGYKYIFSEGGMSPTDSLDLPGRTMLTSEGSLNRSTHLLYTEGVHRLLTPIEAERLQDFPDNWTKFKKNENGEILEVSDRMRMFFMGNALVTEIVKMIGDGICEIEK
ncbi:DNA (cytosine-5-)-methyltransferase [Brochothrix thermosphacta]|uniref:DNA (cytosine-5-)-methyltransferase n=1 Tax=Brochothrix thermosphacta TaxID=2756 RepID=UPI0039AF701B